MKITASANEGPSSERTALKSCLTAEPEMPAEADINMPHDSSIQASQKNPTTRRRIFKRKQKHIDLTAEDFTLVKGAMDFLIEFSQGEMPTFDI